MALGRGGSRRRDARGVLHGVPVTIKENIDQTGLATVNGVEAFLEIIASADSPPVANWKKAGAIVIGRTNTPAFSSRWTTDNTVRGRTHNPWSRAHVPGGSSGGAAAAVAAGMGPLAHAQAPHGLPVGVQVVASRFREDLALDAAEAIEARHPMPTPIGPVD